MTTTGFEVVGASVITVIAVLGKWIENCAHLFAARMAPQRSHGTVALHYECWNFHLHLSLGMLGLAWSQHWDATTCCPLIGFIVAGVVAKGIFADPRPGTLSFFDGNAFLGLYLPNTLALICVAWVLGGRNYLSVENEVPVPKHQASILIHDSLHWRKALIDDPLLLAATYPFEIRRALFSH